MKLLAFLKNATLVAGTSLVFLLPLSAQATTVQVQTTVGDIVINLFDFDPDVQATVDNFLAYVNAGRYDDTFFHRLVPGFVLQAGGYEYGGVFPAPQDTDLNLQEIVLTPGQDNPMIVNEPKYSNVRGTLAMAKFSGQPDSATSQWFINLADNATSLDTQVVNNRVVPGFTVFGVVESGMDVVDALAGFNRLVPGYASPLNELPLQNYNDDDFTNNVIPDDTNLAVIIAVVVLDPTVDTASQLSIVPNELMFGFRQTPISPQPEIKDGGNVGVVFLLFLVGLVIYRRTPYRLNYKTHCRS